MPINPIELAISYKCLKDHFKKKKNSAARPIENALTRSRNSRFIGEGAVKKKNATLIQKDAATNALRKTQQQQKSQLQSVF